ncbi:MAG: hypothetical protein EOO04_10615 [Chitinophagaceae bacterium]|nr:MAG: hypothetical protein EOO04_10615 [Chitinophagaceae bacterium]
MSTGKLPVPSLLRNLFVCIILLLGTNELVYAQMREIYASPLAEVGPVKRIDFFSPKEGFVAFTDGIGFSNDTAHSFRYFNYITSANVDFAYWGINAASKFFINGVKAFDNNTILVYGNYPNAPAILRSTDGGKNFTIVLATVNWSGSPGKGGVTDMVNLKDRSITLAVDADHIYRSASKGLSWDTLQVIPDAHFTNIDGFDNGHVYAWSTTHPQQFIYRSGTDGSGFVPISIRGGTLRAASFINANEGYISVDGVSAPGLYYTRDAGQNWISTLAAGETPIAFRQLKFADAATGYGIANRYDTYQTIDSGKTWQKISRTGFFGSPPQDVHLNTISTYDGNQLWTGGENSLIELNTAMSKTLPPPAPVQPVSLFTIDTTGFHAGLPVKLKSLSEPGLTLQWFVNDKPVGIAAITTYIPGVGRNIDTIKLVVARDLLSDTSIQYQHYPVMSNQNRSSPRLSELVPPEM